MVSEQEETDTPIQAISFHNENIEIHSTGSRVYAG